jgi:pimeloyl-ACP methyl ester carboxylesterase
MVDWRRVAIGVGVAAAGTLAGYVGERALIRPRLGVDQADPDLGNHVGVTRELSGPGGLRLHTETYGPDGQDVPEIVLVHGFCLNRRSWHEQVVDLEDRVRIVTYDQPGHGGSPAPAGGEFTMDGFADCLAVVIEELTGGDRPLVLVGHSLGGMTLLALIRRHPDLVADRVGALLLLSTAAKLGGVNVAITTALRGIARTRAAAERIPRLGRRIDGLATPSDLSFAVARAVGFVRAEDARYVRFVEEQVISTPLDTITSLAPVVLAVDEEAVLETIDLPTIVVVGEDDRLTPVRHARSIRDVNPDVDLIELPGIGHMTQLSAAETVNALIDQLVADVAPTL